MRTNNVTTENCGEYPKTKTHFAEIVVGGTAENPYYNIMYYDPADGEYHIGYGSYRLDFVFKWLSEEFEVVETMTNADRIRAMSDEELAEFMAERYDREHTARILGKLIGRGYAPDQAMRRALHEKVRLQWFDWLRQPVKDGGNDGR